MKALSLQPISIILVDDEPHFRQGLRILLSLYSNSETLKFNVVGEAASVEQLLSLTVEQQPALILLDLELPPKDGISALIGLEELSYKGKVLVLSGHQKEEWVFRAMQAGASGYVLKNHLATQLCEAIAIVLSDQVYLSPEIATSFFRLFRFYAGRSLYMHQTISLTEREQEVLNWLVAGASNADIGEKLHITIATVKAHLSGIFEKLEVTSRTQAIIKALKLGLVQGPKNGFEL